LKKYSGDKAYCYQCFTSGFMFYSRNNLKTHLVGNKKVPTFAPALREKPVSLVENVLKK
jgi:hypothetical protein